jgi:hypothetical protein
MRWQTGSTVARMRQSSRFLLAKRGLQERDISHQASEEYFRVAVVED